MRWAFERVGTGLIAGGILAGGVVLGGCSNSATQDTTERDADGQVVDGGDVGAFRLQLGDCIYDPAQGNVESVPVVPCSEPHVTEVFHVYDIALEDFPGQETVNRTAEETCLERFSSYVGIAYESSVFGLGYITPTAETWDQLDDREVLCTLFRIDGEPKVGSARGTAR